MNAFLAIVVLALMSVATADMSSCGTPNMTSTFNATSYTVVPTPARGITVTFSINGVSSTSLSAVTAVVSTAMVINGTPIPVDVRTMSCNNAGGCTFPPGKVTISMGQLLPGFTPGGDYQTQLMFSGTNAAGALVTFGCIMDAFTI